MKELSLIVLGKIDRISEDKSIEMIYSSGSNLKTVIENAKGKYISFIKEEDKITKDYLEKVITMCKKEFDCCFINYDIQFDYKNKVKISTNRDELANNKPYYGEYIWAFIFNKKKLEKMLKEIEAKEAKLEKMK